MSKISRRSALSTISGAIAVTGTAGAAQALETDRCPYSRIYELGEEISRLLADIARDQTVMVKIYPPAAPGIEGDPVRLCVVDKRANSQTEIEKLFAKWRAVWGRDNAGWETEAEADENYAEYRRLQIAIVESGLVPTSARDLAIQFIVDTDFTGSDWSKHWETIVFGLIGEPIEGGVS